MMVKQKIYKPEYSEPVVRIIDLPEKEIIKQLKKNKIIIWESSRKQVAEQKDK